jgi:orotate phosphoribosyltransferase
MEGKSFKRMPPRGQREGCAVDLRRQKLDYRTKLFTLLKEQAFRQGDITLSSGKKSTFYFDMKGPMMDPEGVKLMAHLILHELAGIKADAVGGLEMGAVPLVAPVAMESPMFARPLYGFFIRKEAKQHGTMKIVEGRSIKGKNVVILDDVTTSGGSAMEAVEKAQEAGATVTLVLSIVDRGEGAEELYRHAGIPFKAIFRADDFLAAT